MLKTVKGIYEDGQVRLLESVPEVGPQEVYVVFPEVPETTGSKPEDWKGIPASAFRELRNLVSWGGDALEDSEKIWDEEV